MADSSFSTDGALRADWDDSFAEQSFDHSLDDFLAQDAMGGAQGSAMALQDGLGGAGIDLGFDGGSLAAFEGAAVGSSGTSAYGRSDAGSSPFNVSNYSFSSAVTGNTSAGPDVDAALGHSPPFSFGGDLSSLACDFDTSALQSLFGDQSIQQNVAQPGSSYLSPSCAFSPPSHGISPATTTAPPYSIPTVSLSQPTGGHTYTFDPAQPAFSSAGSSPSQPRISVDSGSPASATSSSSPPSLYPSISAVKQQAQQAQRPLSSLAATAGVSVPPLQPTSAPLASANTFSLQQDPATLAVLAQHAQSRTIPSRQPPLPVSMSMPPQPVQAPRSAGRAGASPMDVIVNAGLQGNVHQAPPLQLLSHVSFERPAAVQRAAAAGKTGRRGASAQEQQDEQEEKGGKGGAAGKKGGKKSERGHNAVEQKYRNSINNALATLRDTIPALRHLKPLPSMPTSRRKASQFTLASAAVPETPEGLIDGVPAAKTLSKGIILTKAIEYIDFLRSTRDGLNDDIELLKGMVREMVGGGDGLVEEWERRRAENEKVREAARQRQREEDEEAEDGTGEDEEDEEEVAAPVTKGKRAAATTTAGTKRGRKADGPAASKKAKSSASSALTPPLTSEYSRVQALNAAHIESLAQQQQTGRAGQHTFPPSPVSSGDELAVSPAALQNGSGGRVLLASFMGASFAGGIGYDLATTAVVAEETVGTWAGGLVRRSVPTDPSSPSSAVDHLHPSLLSGLAALGGASILVALAYLLYPLFFSSPSEPALPPRTRRRAQAVAALSALSLAASSSSTPLTVGAARKSALDARRELLHFVGAPRAIVLPFAIAKEALVWTVRRATGLTWGRDDGHEDVEEAVAWVRIAEIEASVGGRLPYLSRCYTFLRLSNLSRSPSWPSVTPTTSRAAIDGLIAIQLLALGHIGGARKTWLRMLDRQKKRDSTGNSFVDVALHHDFETVRLLLSPASRISRDDAELAEPSDTVPLLALAEAICQDALEEVWRQVLVVVSDSTSTAPSFAGGAAIDELEDTLHVIHRTTVDGSEVHALASMTKVFLACYRTGLSTKAAVDLSQARELLARLALETKREGPFARLACASAFFQLLAPAVSTGVDFSTFLPKSPPPEPTSEVDLLATVVLSWLLLPRQATSSSSKAQPDAALHARALAIRRLLGHESFKAQPATDDDTSDDEDALDEQSVFQDAKDSLVDALTTVARRAAGLKTPQDEDSGVELESELA